MDETSSYTLKANERLKSKAIIERLFKEGSSLFVHPIKLMYLPLENRDAEYPFLFSVTIPKRIHRKASVRNQLKRRIREAYRQNKPTLVRHDGTTITFALMYILVDKEITSSTTITQSVKRLHRKFDQVMQQYKPK